MVSEEALDSLVYTFLRALNSCLSFFLSPSSRVFIVHATLLRVFVCMYRVSVPGHHWVEAMWNGIYQSQWSIVMKAL